jgi:putative endonuclease
MLAPFRKARAEHLRVGESGEKAACKLLKLKGCEILARNYKCNSGEIDIVARDGASLVFVEVKTRMKRTGLRPAAGLSFKQKNRIHRASLKYMRKIENPEIVHRYDLIEVVLTRWGVSELRHWKNHFKGSETWKKIKEQWDL